MRTSGRFSLASLHCLLSLAALSSKTYVASGLPTKAADGDEHIRAAPLEILRASVNVEADGSVLVQQQAVGDPASVVEESFRTHRSAASRASVTVEADGSVLARQGQAKKGERHLGTFDDDDLADDDISVRQHKLLSENIAEGKLIEARSAGVSEHSKLDDDAAAGRKLTGETWEDVLTVFCVIFMILGAIALLVFLCFFNKKQQPPPQQPAAVWLAAPPQSTDSTVTESIAGKGVGKGKGQDPQSDTDEEDENGSLGSNKSGKQAATASPKVPDQVDREDSDRVQDPTTSKASTIFAY